MIAIAMIAFFLILLAWLRAPVGAGTPERLEISPGVTRADATA